MQVSAPVHFTTEAKKFIVENFRGKVISRSTDNAWPAHSLDLDFWTVAQRRVYEAKSSTIAELINVVEHFASGIREEVLENVALDLLYYRAMHCLQVNGGHFKQLKKTVPKDKMGRCVLRLSKIHY